MVRPAVLVLLFAFGPTLFPAALAGFRGTLLNGVDPYLVRADHGALYRCQWIDGSLRWFEGDRVFLTRASGLADMVKLGEDTDARVEVREICPLEVLNPVAKRIPRTRGARIAASRPPELREFRH